MIPQYPAPYKEFVDDVLQKAQDNNIKVRFLPQGFVYSVGRTVGVSGYFYEGGRELVVCTQGQSPEQTIVMLAHESSHMDQYIDNPELWKKCDKGYTNFFRWLNGEIELSKEKVAFNVKYVIELELDCERRSVEKIKKYKMPFDINYYKRMANTYLYSIIYSSHKREWFSKLPSTESIFNQASTRFKSDYTKIPQRLLKAFDVHAN